VALQRRRESLRDDAAPGLLAGRAYGGTVVTRDGRGAIDVGVAHIRAAGRTPTIPCGRTATIRTGWHPRVVAAASTF
jgi:hypothetical protein